MVPLSATSDNSPVTELAVVPEGAMIGSSAILEPSVPTPAIETYAGEVDSGEATDKLPVTEDTVDILPEHVDIASKGAQGIEPAQSTG